MDAPPSATHGYLGLLIVLSDAELLVIPAWPVAAPQSFSHVSWLHAEWSYTDAKD